MDAVAARTTMPMAEFFRHYIARGESLYWRGGIQAAYVSGKKDEQRWGWPTAGRRYRSVESSAVKRFCEAHARVGSFTSGFGETAA
ncbi:hypothetical protein KCP70_09205 [Salmonella enterica subsp. enterica]|nr:hypothetical protein KCP70_09205 [Salmonella enterica subsp. enterica]